MNRRIFVYWNTGFDQAPSIVRICLESWRRQNPHWQIIQIDDTSIGDWVDMQDVKRANPHQGVQIFSDILRWRLLRFHGGVWVDATLFCCHPLDSWLPASQTSSGFFAFKAKGPHLYNIWFLAGTPKCPVVQAINNELDRFWVTFGGSHFYWEVKGLWRVYQYIERRLNDHNQEFWRSRFALTLLRVYPYYINMYLMGPALRKNHDAREQFRALTTQYGDSVHDLQSYTSQESSLCLTKIRSILHGPAPVQKLSTKRFVEQWHTSGVLDYLHRFQSV